MKIIRLRPHHALCSQFFSGRGYSREFVENMTLLLEKLKNENPKVMVVSGCDDICACCPKRVADKCSSEEEIIITDKFCLDEFGFALNKLYCWSEIKSFVINKLNAGGNLPAVCSDCRWYYICNGLMKNLK